MTPRAAGWLIVVWAVVAALLLGYVWVLVGPAGPPVRVVVTPSPYGAPGPSGGPR